MAGAVPSPGYPIIRLGETFYSHVYGGQTAPNNYNIAWWLRWFAGIKNHPNARKWLSDQSGKYNPMEVAIKTLMSKGDKLAAIEEEIPAVTIPDSDVNFNPFWVSSDSYTLFGGATKNPVPKNVWWMICNNAVGWVTQRWEKKQLNARYLDVVLEYMVFASPANQRIPYWLPPQGIINDEIARAGWNLWKEETGGNNAWMRYIDFSRQRWDGDQRDFQRLDSILGNAESVLRYVSLQEPALRLQEKLEEYFSKRQQLIGQIGAIRGALDVVPDALSPSEQQNLEGMINQFRAIDQELYDKLPEDVWQGEPPQQLSDLGATPAAIAILAIKAAIAIGILAVVAVVLAKLNNIINNGKWYDYANKAQAAAEAEKKRQEELAEQQMSLVDQAVANGSIDKAEGAKRKAQIQEQLARTRLEIDSRLANMASNGPPSSGTGMLFGVAAGAAGVLFLLTRK